MVPGARIELATPAFSGRRSTNELPRLLGSFSILETMPISVNSLRGTMRDASAESALLDLLVCRQSLINALQCLESVFDHGCFDIFPGHHNGLQ